MRIEFAEPGTGEGADRVEQGREEQRGANGGHGGSVSAALRVQEFRVVRGVERIADRLPGGGGNEVLRGDLPAGCAGGNAGEHLHDRLLFFYFDSLNSAPQPVEEYLSATVLWLIGLPAIRTNFGSFHELQTLPCFDGTPATVPDALKMV